MSQITRSPLFWPDNVPRTAPHQRGCPRFKNWTLEAARSFVLDEIDRLSRQGNAMDHGHIINRENIVISTNLRLRQDGFPYSGQPQPADPGVAIYFPLFFMRGNKEIERPIVLTCDKWTRVEWNVYAIAKDIEAQRGRERWGCTNFEQSFRGYLAIPERCGGRPWWEILGIPSTASRADVEKAFRRLSLRLHPDKNPGDKAHEEWVKLQEAHDQAVAATA